MAQYYLPSQMILLKVINESRHDNYTESVMMYHPKPGHHGHSLSCTATNEHILNNNALVDNIKLEIFCKSIYFSKLAIVLCSCFYSKYVVEKCQK